MAMLEVNHLTTEFTTENGIVRAVRDVSLHVEKGEVLGIVGESGSGKSQTMFSVMGLLARNGKVSEGSIKIDGEEISPAVITDSKEYESKMDRIRGNDMAMIFQDPMTFLNPVLRIQTQLIEPIINHNPGISKKEAIERAIELMRKVGIPSPETRIRQYPFQFSGGMRQRIVIAIALASNPQILICDEPTTALDVTIQAQVLDLIGKMQKERNVSTIFITHDLGVVAHVADAGKIVEYGTAEDIFYDPRHPYTWSLMASMPDMDLSQDEELVALQGTPPNMLVPPPGDAFAERNPWPLQVDFEKEPPMFKISDTHYAATWLLHPGAPKVERPHVLERRIQRSLKRKEEMANG